VYHGGQLTGVSSWMRKGEVLRLEDCILIAETFDAAVNDPHSSSSVNPARRLVVRNIILTHSGEYRY
jgi:hypothetical protein